MFRKLIAVLTFISITLTGATGRLHADCEPNRVENLTRRADVIFSAQIVFQEERDKHYLDHLRVLQVFRGEMPNNNAVLTYTLPQLAWPRTDPTITFVLPKKGEFFIIFAKRSSSREELIPMDPSPCGPAFWPLRDDHPINASSLAQILGFSTEDILKDASHRLADRSILILDVFSRLDPEGKVKPAFNRDKVIGSLPPVLALQPESTIDRAIALVPIESPYQDTTTLRQFLESVDVHRKNEAGMKYSAFWMELADNLPDVHFRTVAIRALGHTFLPELRPKIDVWLRSPEPDIRASAALLLADFADTDSALTETAKDTSAEVRSCVAYAIGCGQRQALRPLLDKLLQDPGSREAAQASLASLAGR